MHRTDAAGSGLPDRSSSTSSKTHCRGDAVTGARAVRSTQDILTLSSTGILVVVASSMHSGELKRTGPLVIALITGLLVTSTAAGQRVAPHQRVWWSDSDIQHVLTLSPIQVTELSTLFERDLPQRRTLHERILQMERELNRAIGKDDEAGTLQVLEQLQELQRTLNTRRALMLVRMYRILTPQQRQQLASVIKPDARR
jgi:Spy/CpxP family protein refolding chaperone